MSRHSFIHTRHSFRRVTLVTCLKNKLRKLQRGKKDQLRGHCVKSVRDDSDFDWRVEARMWEVIRCSLREG